MWDLPGPGLEPVSPALAGGFLTTAPPGKSLCFIFCFFISLFLPPVETNLKGTAFEVYMEQSSDDQEGMIHEHFLLFSECVICQCFLVVLR